MVDSRRRHVDGPGLQCFLAVALEHADRQEIDFRVDVTGDGRIADRDKPMSGPKRHNGDTHEEPRMAVEIKVEDLHKAFGEQKILQGVSLEIYRSEVVAIVGGSGCGKSVLLNHILGQLTPDAGRVLVTDHGLADAPLVDLTKLSAREIDRIHIHWGVVFQSNALFSGTVYDNIALWLGEVKNLDDGAIMSIVHSVLESVELPGDDDFLERDVNQLSGGMAKRLAVARALSMDPLVIFYDEPTTGLDPSSVSHIHDLIQATHGGHRAQRSDRSTVIITHDKDLLRRLRPRVVMLHGGRVSFDGPLEEFEASDSSIIRPYFDLMPALHQR